MKHAEKNNIFFLGNSILIRRMYVHFMFMMDLFSAAGIYSTNHNYIWKYVSKFDWILYNIDRYVFAIYNNNKHVFLFNQYV